MCRAAPERVRRKTVESEERADVPDEKDSGQPTDAVAPVKPTVPNEVSDETGQYDMRFLLWRKFCAENGVPVETLPSDLTGEIRDKWDKLKDNRLHKPAEKQ